MVAWGLNNESQKRLEILSSKNACPLQLELKAFDYLQKKLPTSTSNIDWNKVKDRFSEGVVASEDLPDALKRIIANMGATIDEDFLILNLNEATPPLISPMVDWFDFAVDLDYPDTIFLSTSFNFIVHWDFYGNLYGKILLIRNQTTDI